MARRVVIEIVGDTTDVERKLENLRGEARQTGEDANRGMSKAAAGTQKWAAAIKLATAATGALVAGLALVGRSAISTAADIDTLTKTARGLRASAGELQTLERGLGLSGLSVEETDALVQRLTRSLGDAARKGGPAADALRELGLSAEALGRLPLTEQLVSVVGALSNVEDLGTRASAAQELLGRQSRSLMSALEQGEGALRANIDAVRQMGTVTQEQAEESEALTDSVALLTGTLEQLKMDALAPIIPVLDDQIDRFRRLVDLVREYSGIAQDATGEVDRLEQRQRLVAEATAEYERRLAEQTMRMAQGTSTAEQMAHSEREVEAALQEVLRAEELLRGTQEALNRAQGEGSDEGDNLTRTLDEQAESAKRDEAALRDLAKALAQTAAIEAEAQENAAKAARIAAEAKRDAAVFAALEQSRLAKQAAADEIAAHQAKVSEIERQQQEQLAGARDAARGIADVVSSALGQMAEVAERAGFDTAASFARLGQSVVDAMAQAKTEAEAIAIGIGTAVSGLLSMLSDQQAEAIANAGKRIERYEARIQEHQDTLTSSASQAEKDRARASIRALREKQAAERKAAREAFKQQQALSIIQTTIAGALAVVQAFAQLGPVAGGVAAGIIGAITGIQIGLIASQAPPFHLGGVVPQSLSNGAGEVPTRLKPGEGVVNSDGMERLGEDGLARLNRGEAPGGGDSMAAYFVFDGRVLAAAQAQNERRGVVSSRSQRTRVGTARPVAYSR